MINAFICNMTCEALFHVVNHETLRMTQELLDVTMQCATGEEAV
jgi:hypothetical protein